MYPFGSKKQQCLIIDYCKRGFAAKASTQALEAIHTLSMEYVPTIEDDNIVTTQNE